MPTRQVNFLNEDGERLSGVLELPDSDHPPAAFGVFAHCFTCGKNVAAAARISRMLASSGVAVLRFDVTGIGESHGEFSDSNYTSNITDLMRAVEFLTNEYQAPSLLIGHSLGGAAALAAASQLAHVKAVVTIGAPATADHVRHLVNDKEEAILRDGVADVRIGAREFRIKRQFLDDIDKYGDTQHLGALNSALLVFHSPDDEIVPVTEAGRIFKAAQHPRSFVSLDGSDHLVSKRRDAEYVATTLVAWATRYLEVAPSSHEHHHLTDARRESLNGGETLVTELNHAFLRGLYTPDHQLVADEPESVGGTNAGPTPYDLLLMSLGACTSVTLRAYAGRKGINIEDIEVRLRHERVHAEDCESCEETEGSVERIERELRVTGTLSDRERTSLLRIADRCPVHRTLASGPRTVTTLTSE